MRVFTMISCLLLGLAMIVQVQHPARAAPGKAACESLSTHDFSGIQDAPSQVIQTRHIEAAGPVPAHCMVSSYVSPRTEMHVFLPDAWNGKFIKRGCGGFCGAVYDATCDSALTRGFACEADDMGHRSTGIDGKWAYNDLEAKFDFGTRSTHVTALAGKAMTEAYYGQPIAFSYYMGGSTGGRQGLLLAERYPWDFNGIVAGAPVISELGAAVELLWNVRANLDANGKSILKVGQLKLIHKAALDACDAADGLKDGIIGDPAHCAFDPASLLCRSSGAGAKDCLTREQVAVVRKIYDGPVDSKGRKLWPRGPYPGSELNWADNYINDDGPSVYSSFIGDLFRYMAFPVDPGPTWQVKDFDFDRDPGRIGEMEGLYNVSNPDLRQFKAAGGKLIMFQGLADQSVVPAGPIDFYEAVEREMGGRPETIDFMRLFLLPGVNHVIGGDGADSVDYLAYLLDWVEHGKAPDAIVAMHLKASHVDLIPVTPPKPDDIAFSRPSYPYPVMTRYDGKGDGNSAASFGPAEPR